jgi:hypothetical protein
MMLKMTPASSLMPDERSVEVQVETPPVNETVEGRVGK